MNRIGEQVSQIIHHFTAFQESHQAYNELKRDPKYLKLIFLFLIFSFLLLPTIALVMTLKSETMRLVSCVMCSQCSARCRAMSRCSLEVAVTGASGREAHKIDYVEQRQSLYLSLLLSTEHHSQMTGLRW